MAFKLSQSRTYEWPVEYTYVTETGGKLETAKFSVDFTRDATILEKIDERDEDGKRVYKDIDIAKMLVKGWKDVVDENGEEVEFSEEVLEEAVNDNIGFKSALIDHWVISINKAQEKNSKKSALIGQNLKKR